MTQASEFPALSAVRRCGSGKVVLQLSVGKRGSACWPRAWTTGPMLLILIAAGAALLGRSQADPFLRLDRWPLLLAGACAVLSLLVPLRRTLLAGQRAGAAPSMTLGPYRLGEKIGEGGMGVVYKARHALLERPTAVKVLHPSRCKREDIRRFEREVQLTSSLTHPNTISIYDFGRTEQGAFYYAMEYLDGLDLQALVERDGPQDPARVAHLLAQLCGALAEAHGRGLIHRDVKPANIVVCARGGVPDVVKLLDFGLIKRLGEAPVELSEAHVQAIVGTPLYMSPEALTAPDTMDGRSDLYAIGAVGYFLLTGEPPFSGTGLLEVCARQLHSVPIPPSQRTGCSCPAELEDLILSCLSKAMHERPVSAAALRQSLLPLAATWTEQRAAGCWTIEKVQSVEAARPFALRGVNDCQCPGDFRLSACA